jgi:hypothetical protein
MIGGRHLGMQQVNLSGDRASCRIWYSRADTARPDDARQPVDRARPVENAQSAFPTKSLDAQNASTRSTGVLMVFDENNKRPSDDAATLLRRITRPAAVVASLR